MDNMIGQRIKDRRKELNITQTQIQQETSISTGNLSCIENGKYLPSAVALLELSNVLNCSVDWLLTGKSEISNNLGLLDISENELLEGFRKLSQEDKEELLDILSLKLRRIKRKKETMERSSDFKNSDNMVC